MPVEARETYHHSFFWVARRFISPLKQGAVPFFQRAVWLVSMVLAFGCAPNIGGFSDAQGPGKRPQRLVLTPEEELDLGRRTYSRMLAQMRDRIVPEDDPASRRSRFIMGKLVKAAGIEPLQREINLRLRGYHFEWEVHVVRTEEINALCLPGGKMLVFTGILQVADNDDQLAAVLGHEIAHALAHHANERVARDESGKVSFLRGKSYDRQQESEADHIGLFLMTFAGFDPHETVRFWQKMEQRTRSGRVPEFLSDHPSGEHRVRDFQTWVPQAIAGKKAFDEGRIVPARTQ